MKQFKSSQQLPLQHDPMQWASSQNEPRPTAKPPARRVRFSWRWLVVGLVAGLIVGIFIGFAVRTPGALSTPLTKRSVTESSQPIQSSQPIRVTITPAATHALTWITVKKFAGSGNQMTGVFPIQHDWKILWSCDPKLLHGTNGNLKVAIYGPPDGTLIDVGVNVTCKTGSTGNSTEVHKVGQFFLVITGTESWNLQIQELQ
jgi:hypothetical protein